MKKISIFFVTFFLSAMSCAQNAPVDGEPPEKIIERLWMDATAGYLLTSDGFQRASGHFVHPEDTSRNRPLFVVSNYWGLGHSEIKGDRAKVDIEFNPVGYIDSKLRFKASSDDDPCAMWQGMLYNLALVPTYSVMYRSEKGKLMEAEKKPTGHLAWQITDPPDLHWTTVNTAIRYLLEKRSNSKDPVIRNNADRTIRLLLHYY